MSKQIAKRILNTIQDAKKIMLVPHQHPDGDTLGSLSAVAEWLKNNDIPFVAFCATPISKKLAFLPHVRTVSQDPLVWQDPDIDTVLVFDSGDLQYAGVDTHVSAMSTRPTIINIDHHATNEYFGDINLVRTDASSTTAVLYAFFRANTIPINAHMATGLLTGLVTDTDSFTNAATNTTSLKIGSALILKGGNLPLINEWVMKDRSVDGLKLWGVILARMEHHTELDIVYTYVTQEDIERHKVSESEIEGIANFLNTLEDGRAGMILTERADGQVKGSFRTTLDHVDVSAFAKALGGGGHKKAAGFSISGPIEHALSHVFDTVKSLESEGVTH